jgi:hypothetical protein
MIFKGITEELREKPVPVPLCPPLNPMWADLGLCNERPEPWHSLASSYCAI